MMAQLTLELLGGDEFFMTPISISPAVMKTMPEEFMI